MLKIPYIKKCENIHNIFTNLFYMIILTLFLVMEKNKSMDQKEKHNKLGVTCVVVIIIILLTNAFMAIFELIQLFRKALIKIKKGNNSKVSASVSSVKVRRMALGNVLEQQKIEIKGIENTDGIDKGLEKQNNIELFRSKNIESNGNQQIFDKLVKNENLIDNIKMQKQSNQSLGRKVGSERSFKKVKNNLAEKLEILNTKTLKRQYSQEIGKGELGTIDVNQNFTPDWMPKKIDKPVELELGPSSSVPNNRIMSNLNSVQKTLRRRRNQQ